MLMSACRMAMADGAAQHGCCAAATQLGPPFHDARCRRSLPRRGDAAMPRSARTGLVLFALAMGGFAIGTTEFASMSLLPFFSAGLGIDEPTAGHVISAYALGVVVGAPVIAVLAAKVDAPDAADRPDGRLRRRQLPERACADLWLDAGVPLPERPAAWRLFRRCGAGRRLARRRRTAGRKRWRASCWG